MNENEMTDEQMEDATNPFAGMAVDGDESVKGVTDSEREEMQSLIDADGDGEVSEEELDNAVDALADIESGVSSDPISDATVRPDFGQGPFKEDLIEHPSKKSLAKLFPPSQDKANRSHQQDWARYCVKFANENDLHFLGLCVKTGEPMFKEIK